MNRIQSRRRFIHIAGAAAGLLLMGLGDSRRPAAESPLLHCWQGIALGADASLKLYHPDAAEAARLIADSLAEVRRLERIFSLYDQSSALCRLNRAGELADPPQELVELLAVCGRIHRATGGAFDATVQPLWDLYAGHFSAPDADPAGPSPVAIGHVWPARASTLSPSIPGGSASFAPAWR